MISYFNYWILNFEWKNCNKLLIYWNERFVFIFIHLYFFLEGGGSRFTFGSKIMLTLLNSLISKRPFHLGIKLKWNMSTLRLFNAGFHKSIACILSQHLCTNKWPCTDLALSIDRYLRSLDLFLISLDAALKKCSPNHKLLLTAHLSAGEGKPEPTQ